MSRIKILLVAVIFFAVTLNPFYSAYAQRQLSENAQISVLTCDTGNELYSLFGHTAIRINDPANGIDVVFNYGMFDFRTPNFYLKFIKGDLQYFVSTSSFEDFYADYLYNHRAVYEQQLNLTLVQKQKLFDELVQVLSSQDRYYTYKFIDRNCTTMVVDRVNANINGHLSLKVKDSGLTNRRILYGYLSDHFYENLGINIMFGAKTDKDFYKLYLPLQLMESISISTNNGKPLTNATKIVNPKTEESAAFSLWNNWYTYVLFLLVVIMINRRSIYLTWFIVMGALGVFLFAVGFYSLHEELDLNYNILLFNPLFFVLVYFALRDKLKWAVKMVYVCLAILLIYTIVLIPKVHFVMFLPIILTNSILLGRMLLKYKKALKGL